MRAYRHMGLYGHMVAYGCTCLPTSPEGMCKKFSFPLLMSHFHHLSTEMEGKKPIEMPECTPLNTHPNYPTK